MTTKGMSGLLQTGQRHTGILPDACQHQVGDVTRAQLSDEARYDARVLYLLVDTSVWLELELAKRRDGQNLIPRWDR